MASSDYDVVKMSEDLCLYLMLRFLAQRITRSRDLCDGPELALCLLDGAYLIETESEKFGKLQMLSILIKIM